ncbi:MAG TPA: hypothetical protein VJU86_21700 [Pyrinomonadaceae bacterium]|nr:hypothetical protein [Pyrinomonadaceae bacterium]
MSRSTFRNVGTLKLQCDYMKYNKQYDRTLDATLLNPIRRMFKRGKAEKLRVKLDGLEDQLAKRYEGVMVQMLRRASIVDQRSIRFVWSIARRRVLSTSDERTLAKILWDAYCEQAGGSSVLWDSLKPKFMLRQFIDEMQEKEERGVLRSLAYGGTGHTPSTTEGFEMFNTALQSLHYQLLNHSSILHILTDNTVTSADVKGFHPPYVQYSDWLIKA